MDPSSAAQALPVIHLTGYFDDPFSGAELELMSLARLLGPTRSVKLWSVVPPHPVFASQAVTAVQPFAGNFPRKGVLVWGGVHVPPAPWLKYGSFERVVLQCNLASFERLFTLIEIFRDTTSLEPELVFASEALRLTAGLPGKVIYSPMDIQPFLHAARLRNPSSTGALTVGRVSRDAPDKHHPQDPLLYRMLAAKGWRVRIMGGTCLAPQLQGVEGVELLPAGAGDVVDFYQSLDVFFYRTGATVEAYGRVVAEAMASGLPVVAGIHGGYAEVIVQGESGLLVASQEDAWEALSRLAAQPLLRQAMVQAGVRKAELLHGEAAIAAVRASY
ncbi:glycosyltransferase family 4 protein [Polaromonas sp.]|uniref:glycosyltransferase family 4 protein n=1 Tax=Polaromonas sp. TaxID=1869339 RepID=UPI003C867192